MRLCLFLVGVFCCFCFVCLFFFWGEGEGGGARWVAGASCNKLHGACCNINKFINFVGSVRPKKAIPYTD